MLEKYNKKKVLIVTPYWPPARLGGAEIINKEIAFLLKKNNFDVTVLTSCSFGARYFRDLLIFKSIKTYKNKQKGIKIIRLKHNPLKAFLIYLFNSFLYLLNFKDPFFRGPIVEKKEIENILCRDNFDIIYCAPFPLRLIKHTIEVAEKIKNENKKNFLLIVRPDFKKAVGYFTDKSIGKYLRIADLIHVTTNSEKKDIISIFKIHTKKLKKISCFLDLKKLQNINIIMKKVEKFKRKINLNNKKIILFMGNKSNDKGISTLLKAMEILFKKDKSYRLITVGEGDKTWFFLKNILGKSYKSFLIDMNYIEGVKKEIIFGSCDVFCMPSKNDSFGLVYLEAWYKRKPVIGAKFPAIQEIIEKNKGGVCVEFGNALELAREIERLSTNKKLAGYYGKNGYRALIKNYTLEKIENKILRLFNLKYEKN